jgi:hypothetical protein
MKRRTFISTLAALAATPALPATTLGAQTHITQHFARAKLLARCHDRASPEMFARLMKLDQDTAKGVYTMLKDKNVIAGGLDGIARAINPLNTHCVPNEALRARDFAKVASDVSTRLRDMAKKRVEQMTEPPAPDTLPLQDRPEDDTPQQA